MDEPEIRRRIEAGEDSATEFKSATRPDGRIAVNAESIADVVAAFANAEGGLLLVGVDDGGQLTGCGTPEEADAVQRQIVSACRDLIRPALNPEVRKFVIDGLRIVVAAVPQLMAGRPFGVNGRYRIRVGATNQDAAPAELRRMLHGQDFHYDEQPLRGATRDDLDAAAVRAAFDRAMTGRTTRPDVDAWLASINCLSADGVPTVAGALMFARDPQAHAPLLDARVSAVRIAGTKPSMTFLDRQEIAGRLPEQFEAAVEFLRHHTENRSRLEGTQRVDERPFGIVPESALREVILNALCHRDYSMAAQVRVLVYDDRIEVISPGDLVNRLTIQALRAGAGRISRNPILSERLKKHLGREALGFGIPEMIGALTSVGLPEPEFEVVGGQFRVIFRTLAGGSA